MRPKYFCLLLLAVIARAAAQGEEELHIPIENIPVENDNQFPPDNHSETDGSIIEGSGAGAIEEPVEATTLSEALILEEVQLPVSTDKHQLSLNADESSCPKPCVCNIEGDSTNYIVDCSGYDLTEFPKPIDVKTTTLNIQNNKLTVIPKEVSALKDLKVLNAYNNSIMELVSGSISELPELSVLKLGNNRLIEYPKDLKNSFGLTKLEELDLGDNDMRTPFTHETFLNFKALRKLTLPTSTSELVEDLCRSLKESLETICTNSCSTELYDCPDAPGLLDELDVVLPGTIALNAAIEDSVDPAVAEGSANSTTNSDNVTTSQVQTEQTNVQLPNNNTTETSASNTDDAGVGEFSMRSTIIKAADGAAQINSLVQTTKEGTKETDVAVGATTSGTKTGSVDKSVIGIIVAGMVLVVAGITIKKNWSSIKNRFSSSPRVANDRTGANANGTTPEEVPLQDKSPV